MELVQSIFLVILFLSLTVLCYALIIYLGKITKSVQAVELEITTIAKELPRLMDSMEQLSNSVQELTTDLHQQVQKAGWVVDQISEKIEAVLSIGERLGEKLPSSIPSFIANLQAIKFGVAAFFKSFTRK